MKTSNTESQFLSILQSFDLSENEAQVYLALINAGERGSIVKELNHILPLKRTNIYNILHKLICLGCVKEGAQAETAKNATIYMAVQPIDYLGEIINEKKLKLKKLEEIRDKHSDSLQALFQQGLTVSYDDIDPIIKPYFKPLLENGWRIKSYTLRREVLDYQVYDCTLLAPHTHTLKLSSFHLFIFNYNIERDKTAQDYFTKSLKRKTKEMKSFTFGASNLQMLASNYEIHDKNLTCFDLYDDKKEIGKAVIVKIKEKLFYILAESNLLEEILDPIFEVENFI